MDINEVYESVRERVTFLKGMIRLAKVDGKIANEERIFFRNVAIGFGISQNDMEYLEAAMDENLDSKLFKSKFTINFDNKKKCLFFLKEAIQLCYADGIYQKKEKKEIINIASEMGVSNDSVKAIEQWVQEGIEWQQKGIKLLDLE